MYQNAAILAAFLLLYSAVAGRIERSWVSGPIVFTAFGLLLGPYALGVMRLNIGVQGLRNLAEFALAMVLFTDAANADFSVVRWNISLPERLLLVGLPLTIVLGFLLAAVMFPRLDIPEMALLAAILAPTDAALGAPVVTNEQVPAVMREGLNLESGLNDGICVPIVVLLLGLAVGGEINGSTTVHVIRVVVEEIGIGLVTGVALTAIAAATLRFAHRRAWTSARWLEVPIVALAGGCFAWAQAMGGSGFIACFSGGLMLNWLGQSRDHRLLRGAENVGEALALLTWVLFGNAVVGRTFERFSWPVLLYAILSLTVIRMVPVYLCLSGTGMRAAEKLFVGWFGPRGLATIVFGIIVFGENLPGNETILGAAGWTVLLSIIAHGVTANPLVKAIGTREATVRFDAQAEPRHAAKSTDPPSTR